METDTTPLGEGTEALRAQGPTDAEVITYCSAAIAELNRAPTDFEKNVQEVGVWANDIDASFDRTTRKFSDLVKKYGKDYPGLKDYSNEWQGYNKRWVTNLLLSRDVASEQSGVLNRFENVFLEMIQTIKTEQDRLDAILELQSFVEEDHSSSQKMSQAFFVLKQDIAHFVVRLDAYLADKKVALSNAVKTLQADVNRLQAQISDLDKKVIRLVVTTTALGKLQAERNNKARQFEQKEKELADANRKQQALAQLQTDIDGLEPDISLICERLVDFSEIWTSVSLCPSGTDDVESRAQIDNKWSKSLSMSKEHVLTPQQRFIIEVELARKTCTPTRIGLEKYATELENRPRAREELPTPE
ncbi:hypothetical protein MD484_g2100, partial [Candolleomyces efflorescens]